MNFAGPFDSKLSHDSPVSIEGERFSFESKTGFVQSHEGSGAVIIPDAHLLFSGVYTRIGNDLIISGPDQKFVVGSYFKGETRPALSTKDGATLSGHIVDALTGHVHYAQATAPGAGQTIGHVLKMSGSASAIRNGVSVELHIGNAVQKGDVIQTGSDSSIGMTLVDGSAFGMTSNARMVLNEMVYDPNGSSNSSLMSLVQGTVTFVAGQTAKNGNMRVETPVATMGIRGTAVLVEIGADNGPTKFSVLAEPDGHTGSYNLYDKTSGQLIGTVSQAGQVTFVSVGGIGQPATAVEQLKTLADQQSAKAIIQQVFQLYFPNYTPDDSNPNSKKSQFGSPGDNINPFAYNVPVQDLQPPKIIVVHGPWTDPATGVTVQDRVFYNVVAKFSTHEVNADQSIVIAGHAPVSMVETFKLGDQVVIDDPDIGNAPFFDIPTPFVSGSAVIKTATSTIPFLSANYLKSLLTIDQSNGKVTFDRLDFNFLDDGQTVMFMIEVESRSGPTSGHVQIPVTITGANDEPKIVVGAMTITERDITEEGTVATQGTIQFKDLDLTDKHTATFELTSTESDLPGFTHNATNIGDFSIDLSVTENLTDQINTGTLGWHFTVDNSDPILQSLAEGQTITQVYTITIKDNNDVPVTQNVTITLIGTNDAPMLVADVTAVHNASELTDSTGATTADTACGELAFTDVDLTDTHVASAVLDSDPASSIVWSGHAAGDLPPGLRLALQNAISTSISTSDDSTGSGAGTVHWNFSASDDLFDFLGEHETLTLTYDVTVADYYHDADGAHLAGTSSTQTITVVIGAANDRPVILDSSTLARTSAESLGATGGSTTHTITGAINYSDADAIDVNSIPQVNGTAVWTDINGDTHAVTDAAIVDLSHLVFGTVDQNSNTAGWTYTVADNALDFLAAGETLVVTYDVTVEDNSGAANDTSTIKQITVTITGANDAPTIAIDTSGTAGTNVYDVPETDSGLTTSGTLAVKDVDITNTVAASVFGLMITGTGAASLPLGLDNDALKAMFVVDASSVIDNAHTTGTIHWDFNSVGQAFDFLAAGETLILTYTVRATDSDASHATGDQTVVVQITGTNDVPVIAGVSSGSVTEDTALVSGNLVTDGTLTISDADHDQSSFVAQTSTAGDHGYGVFTLGTDGHWTYTADNSQTVIQQLAAGESLTDSFTTHSLDGTADQVLTVTIHGINDVPVIAGATTGSVTEDTALVSGNLVTDGTLTISDADHDQSSFVAQTSTAGDHGYGVFTLGTDGHWTYTANNSQTVIQQLGEGESLMDSFTTHSLDGTADQVVTVTINGTNDTPVLNGDNVSTLELGGGVTKVSGIALSDVDAGADTFTVTATAVYGTVATATGGHALAGVGISGSFADISNIFSDGAVYTPENSSSTDKVTLTVTDSHGGSDKLNFIFKQYDPAGGVTLLGTTGKDIIFSSMGDDTMTGLTGQDNFVFASSSGHDTIMDFSAGSDKIDFRALTGMDATALTALLSGADHTDGDMLLHLNGATDTLLVKNLATLHATDFILHA